MKAWPEILAECARLVLPLNDNAATDKRPPHRRVRPEAAFRITLSRKVDGCIDLENIVGGIPKIMPCVVHPVNAQLAVRWLLPDKEERLLGIVMRHPHREDLYLFYRSGDASLVLYTLPERDQSKVMLVPLEDRAAIRQSILGGGVCRIAFEGLALGRYLVTSFSMTSVDDLQQQALLLRKKGSFTKALALIEDVLELDPENFEAWARKGGVLRELARRDEAMVALKKALEINPECALAWRLKGALLRDADEHLQGLNCYLRSLQLDPADFICWQNKGNALTALDRTEEAKEAYAEAERVKELYPEERY